MRITVDLDDCDGHGVCVDTCPQVFALGDDDDWVTVLQPEPDESLRGQVKQAEALCPKAAIRVEG
jgi:ferredoxin